MIEPSQRQDTTLRLVAASPTQLGSVPIHLIVPPVTAQVVMSLDALACCLTTSVPEQVPVGGVNVTCEVPAAAREVKDSV